MDAGEVLAKCQYILAGAPASVAVEGKSAPNFLDLSHVVADYLKSPQGVLVHNEPWIIDFAQSLRRLRDTFAAEVAADPMSIYTPAHDVAVAFHKSTALIRYFRGGNRISKTESGAFEHYGLTTGQLNVRREYRQILPPPLSTFIIGATYAQYGTAVFEKKYLTGENGNPLSPIFPQGGKWLHHYDDKKHIIYIACPQCAVEGKARNCRHLKSTIQLFSDEGDVMVLAGGQYALGQFDEHIQEKFLGEAMKRLETVPYSSLMVTHTPLEGKGAWEHQKLTIIHEEGPPRNLVEGTTRPLVGLFTIDQFAAGLSPHENIRAAMKVMAPAEIEARVYGRPAAFSATGVFDAFMLSDMYDEVKQPTRGDIQISRKALAKKYRDLPQVDLLAQVGHNLQLDFEARDNAELRIWEHPLTFGQYIVGADVAQGLTSNDASCAVVLKLSRSGFDVTFEMVAQYHGWINSLAYAEELMKLCLYYNSALLVPERRGPGDATIQRLKELGYANLFRDLSDPAQAQVSLDGLFGLDTNVKTKGIFIAMLQNVIKDQRTGKRSIKIPCFNTLEEFGHFGQERTETGLSYRFRGEGGMHDDRVIAVALGVYTARVYPDVYNVELEVKARRKKKKRVYESEDEELVSRSVWKDYKRQLKEAQSDE
jgi:hypothetical protein